MPKFDIGTTLQLLSAAKNGAMQKSLDILKNNSLAIIHETYQAPNANFYQLTEGRKTALYYAIERKHDLLAQCLLMLGADRALVLALARDLNDDDVERMVQSLPSNFPLLRILLIWAIENNQPACIANILSFARHSFDSASSEEEQKESIIPQASTLNVTYQAFEREMQSFIEFACCLGQIECARTFVQAGYNVRNDPQIRTAAYWLFTNPAFENNCLELAAPTVEHQAVLFAQLEKEKKFECLGKIYCSVTNEVRVKAQSYKIEFKPDRFQYQLVYDVDDIISFHRKLTAKKESPINLSDVVNFESELEAFYYRLFQTELYELPQAILQTILDDHELIVASSEPKVNKLTELQSLYNKALIYYKRKLYLLNKEGKIFDDFPLDECRKIDVSTIIAKQFPEYSINIIMQEVNQAINPATSVELTKNLFQYPLTPNHVQIIAFYDRFMNMFPGYFSYILRNKIASHEHYSYDSFELYFIKKIPFANETKNKILLAILQEKYKNFDLTTTRAKSIYTTNLKMIGLKELVEPTNIFTKTNTSFALSPIIDFLDTEAQIAFAQTCWQFNHLINEPRAQLTRLELLKLNRENKILYNVKAWKKISSQLISVIDKEIGNMGFFEHRMTNDKKKKWLIILALFLIIGLLGVGTPYFTLVLLEAKKIKAQGKDIVIYNVTGHDAEDPLTCADYSGSGAYSAMNCYRAGESIHIDENVIWPMSDVCLSFCHELSKLSVPFKLSLMALCFGVVGTIVKIIYGYNSDTFRLRGRERFEELSITKLSMEVQTLVDNLVNLEEQIPICETLAEPSTKSIADLRTHLTANRNIFFARNLISANEEDENNGELAIAVSQEPRSLDEEDEKIDELVVPLLG